MPNERYNAEIGLSFVGGNVASQVVSEIQRILREADSAAQAGGGILDMKTADQFGERLGAAIRRAVNQDIKGSALYDLMRPKDQKALLGIDNPAPGSQFLTSQLRLLQAEKIRDQVAARASLTPGADARRVPLPDGSSYIAKSYPDVATRDTAIRAADLAYGRAIDANVSALRKFAQEIGGAERKEQEARASAISAIMRRTAVEDKAAQSAEVASLKGVLATVQAAAKRRNDAEAAARATETNTRKEQEGIARANIAVARYSKAVDAAAEAEETRKRNLSDARDARNFPVSYPGAGALPNQKLGAAQEAVNIAERNVAIAENRLAEADDKLANDRSRINSSEVLRAENALEQAMRGETAARRRVEQEEIRAAEILGKTQSGSLGLAAQFGQGFKGVSDRPFAEQIGQAFKFSVFYGTAYKALFALTQTFQQTLQEGILFENSVSELRLATGQTADSARDLANQVGREASQYGFAPSAAVAIAARAQGYYGTAGLGGTADGRALQDQVGATSARVVNQVAFASGGQPDEIQGQIAAITQAYGLGYQSQQMIGDLDAYMSRKFGINPGETIGAIAESGTVGRAAGFTPAEVSAIAADIQARTGATPQSTGGFLAQIFSRSGEGSLTAVTQKYGINQSDTFAQQLAALAKVYATASPNQRDEISAVGGRGKVQNAFIALLQDYPEVQKAAAEANTKAPGALDKATDLRLNNIGGQIQQLQGVLRQFANDLGQSGLLDDLGILVIGLKDLVVATDDILQVFNRIPHAARDLIFTFGLLAAAGKFAASSQGKEGIAGVLSSLSRGNLVRASTLTGERAVVNGAGVAVPLASVAGARAATGSILGGLGGFGVAAAFLGDAVLWSKARDATNRYAQASNDFADAVSSHAGQDLTTPEGLAARASMLKQQSDEEKKAAGSGWWNFARYKDLGADRSQALRNASFADTQATALEQASKLVEAHNAALAASAPGAAITGFDADGLDQSLTAITTAGGTAKTQFDALASSLDASSRAANRVAAFDPAVFASTSMQTIYEAILGAAPTVKTKPNGAGEMVNNFIKGASFGLSDGPIGSTDLSAQLVQQGIDPSVINKRLQTALAGVTDPSKLGKRKLTSIAANVLGDLPDQIQQNGGFDFSELPEIRQKLTDAVIKSLQGLIAGTGGLAKDIKLTKDESTAMVDRLVQSSQGTLSLLAQTDYSGRVAQQRALIRRIHQTIAQTEGGATPEDLAQLTAARRALAASQFDQLEAERKAAQQNAATAGGVAAAGHAALVQEIQAAVKGNDPDTLAKIISQSGKEAITLARQAIQQAIAAARAAQAIAVESANIIGTSIDAAGHGGSYAAVPKNPLIKQLQHLAHTLSGDTTAGPGGDVYQNGGDVAGAAVGSPADQAAAAAQADAIRKQGQIAKARADIVAAHAAMDDAKRGSVAWYNALGQLYQAQQELAAAVVQYNENLYLLGHDITNPLTQARAAARAAAATLRNDRSSGAAGDQIAADKVALEQAQANAESTAFQQRLQSVQTADQLGQISHQKYLNYLQHEHDRLESIKHRTYQQQQELDQVDGLIKSANDALQGEFNFGDIKLPTPYEVQRRLQEVYGTTGGGLNHSSDPFLPGGATNPIHAAQQNNTTILINGADIGAVKKVLKEILGDRATTSTTAARHR